MRTWEVLGVGIRMRIRGVVGDLGEVEVGIHMLIRALRGWERTRPGRAVGMTMEAVEEGMIRVAKEAAVYLLDRELVDKA